MRKRSPRFLIVFIIPAPFSSPLCHDFCVYQHLENPRASGSDSFHPCPDCHHSSGCPPHAPWGRCGCHQGLLRQPEKPRSGGRWGNDRVAHRVLRGWLATGWHLCVGDHALHFCVDHGAVNDGGGAEAIAACPRRWWSPENHAIHPLHHDCHRSSPRFFCGKIADQSWEYSLHEGN